MDHSLRYSVLGVLRCVAHCTMSESEQTTTELLVHGQLAQQFQQPLQLQQRTHLTLQELRRQTHLQLRLIQHSGLLLPASDEMYCKSVDDGLWMEDRLASNHRGGEIPMTLAAHHATDHDPGGSYGRCLDFRCCSTNLHRLRHRGSAFHGFRES